MLQTERMKESGEKAEWEKTSKSSRLAKKSDKTSGNEQRLVRNARNPLVCML